MPYVLDLFGDESATNSAVTHGLVVSPCKKTSAVETALGEVKKKFGANQEARLHCREIFWGDRRKSTVWADLEPKDVFDFVGKWLVPFRPLGRPSELDMLTAAAYRQICCSRVGT